MKKRLLSLFLIAALCLSFTACDKGDDDTATKEQPSTTATTTTTVAPKAVGLFVDDAFCGAMERQEDIQAVLDTLQARAVEPFEDTDHLQVSFVQDVRMETVVYTGEDLCTEDYLYDYLTETVRQHIAYTVQTGDTFAQIANVHNLTVAELQNLNPDVEDMALEVGQELTVQRAQRRLQVKVEITTYEEGVVIPYKTRTVYRDDKESDWSQVTTEGKDGVKNVTTHVTYVDGVETQRIEDEEIIQEAVTKAVERGSKGTATTDTWVWPVPVCHHVYQDYHSGHLAIDISNGPEPVLGKPAVAANGGEVIFAGWYYEYGYTVKIRHDNGLVTVYAHLESVSVEAGQRVAAGQEIGKVGNTGYSSGPHLHFEVIKNGIKVNPLDYVKP